MSASSKTEDTRAHHEVCGNNSDPEGERTFIQLPKYKIELWQRYECYREQHSHQGNPTFTPSLQQHAMSPH